MEITYRGLILAIAPVLITAAFSSVDNAVRWRSEMEQKQFDRQTRVMERIMDISDPIHRLSVAEFYLSTGLFTGGYRTELLVAIQQTQQVTSVTESPVVEMTVPEDLLPMAVPSEPPPIQNHNNTIFSQSGM